MREKSWFREYGLILAAGVAVGIAALILTASGNPKNMGFCIACFLRAGVVTGLGGYAGHSHKYKKAGGSGYLFRAATVQDFSAVTGACLLVRASVWDEVKGLDEKFAVAFNDVDFCLRVRDKGYRIVWTPYAQLTHYESKSRGGDEKDPVKAARFAAEQQRLYDVHGKADILDDPYYNPSLTHDREDFSESGDLRNLKEGKVTVRWRDA